MLLPTHRPIQNWSYKIMLPTASLPSNVKCADDVALPRQLELTELIISFEKNCKNIRDERKKENKNWNAKQNKCQWIEHMV